MSPSCSGRCSRPQRPSPPFARLSYPGLFPFAPLLLPLDIDLSSPGRAAPVRPGLDNASLLPPSPHTPTTLRVRVCPVSSDWPMSATFRRHAPPSPAPTAPPAPAQQNLKRRRSSKASQAPKPRDTSIADQPQICASTFFSFPSISVDLNLSVPPRPLHSRRRLPCRTCHRLLCLTRAVHRVPRLLRPRSTPQQPPPRTPALIRPTTSYLVGPSPLAL